MITSTLGEDERNHLMLIGDFIWLQNEKKKKKEKAKLSICALIYKSTDFLGKNLNQTSK